MSKVSYRHLLISTLLVVAFSPFQLKGQAVDDELIKIVKKELDREIPGFKSVNPTPYYLAYKIKDGYTAYLSSSFGSLIDKEQRHIRSLHTTVRVGDYNYDNTHINERGFEYREMFDPFASFSFLPLENNEKAIRMVLWRKTQEAYQSARLAYQSLKTDGKDPKDPPVGDFSKEQSNVFVEPPLADFNSVYDERGWQERICRFTRPFSSNTDIIQSTAQLIIQHGRDYFVSSEGTIVAQNRVSAYLTIQAAIRTADGDVAPLYLPYFAFQPSALPTDEKILADVNEMIGKLTKLQKAPRAEPYSGPAILHAKAAGVFFHEIFGHRIEGHRMKESFDSQTFKGMLESQVLPKNLSVVSDPTRSQFDGQDLNGYYQFDDEGIKSQKVTVVDRGVLKTFLMSRRPLTNLGNSNGHGRGEGVFSPVSRQSNLIVKNSSPISMKDMRKRLMSECKKQKKEYGYLFMEVTGGFTMTDRFMPNAFNIFPIEVYRVYTDGRPDELVHGVNLIGTPLSMFAEIQASDDLSKIFTGFCGAESGSVPVTAISPSIYVSRIETQKKPQAEIEQNILPRPLDKD
jgi:TldD protein